MLSRSEANSVDLAIDVKPTTCHTFNEFMGAPLPWDDAAMKGGREWVRSLIGEDRLETTPAPSYFRRLLVFIVEVGMEKSLPTQLAPQG